MYTFRETCAEDATLEMGDETTKIFLNSKGRREGIDSDLAVFLDYIDVSCYDMDTVPIGHKRRYEDISPATIAFFAAGAFLSSALKHRIKFIFESRIRDWLCRK